MGKAKEKPYFAVPTDYEDDTYAWAFEQAELLRQKRFAEMDLPNVIEELESMGKEQLHALTSSYRLLIAHLLKWQYQPEKRSASWQVTISRERDNIEDRLKANPSLKAQIQEIVTIAFGRGLKEAMIETGLPRAAFPAECPYSFAQLRDPDYLPDESDFRSGMVT
ncbi:DUF29 domain-containing protein [Oryzibacter oryziterrae]|uniref:DUF29 domain-containing protein n=1 Tax=Oryzibacter oryziterrae TaxID=2766474 RepID=UPI001F35C37A|nr:DUF29 domain-containing protein [Oryzibacter oryziterrae]